MTDASFEQSLNDLVTCWKNSPEPTIKISSYFPIYVKLFNHLRNTPCVFIETGIFNGGSLFMWKSWLGEQARIIGVDLNPEALKWNNSGFEIHIGDQGDPAFWTELFKKVGPFDVLLDDGGHQSFQQIVTASEAIRYAPNEAQIVIEDTATSFMKDFQKHEGNSFLEFCKDATDCLVGRSFGMYPERFPANYNNRSVEFFRHVQDIQFFNGIVSFHLDPAHLAPPQVILNKALGNATDFRYEGKDCAAIEWPDILNERQVLVRGGR